MATVFEGIDIPALLLDGEQGVRYANPPARNILAFPPDPAGANLLDHLRSVFYSENDWSFSSNAGGRRVLEVYRPESEHFNPLYLSLDFSKPLEEAGTTWTAVFVRNDTRKRLEHILQEDFLGAISHKIRTPIIALSYSMNLVRRRRELGFSEDEVDDFMEQAFLKALELSEVFEKLIPFTAVLKDRPAAPEESFELGGLLGEVVQKYDRKYGPVRRPYRVTLEGAPETVHVGMPRNEGFLLFENLVDNAVKFNDAETAVVKIEWTAGESGDAEILVRDNGRGIPPEYRERIFEPYFQIDKYFTGTVAGVGLGLSLVKRVLEIRGRTVAVESMPDKGSVFRFSLPRARRRSGEP